MVQGVRGVGRGRHHDAGHEHPKQPHAAKQTVHLGMVQLFSQPQPFFHHSFRPIVAHFLTAEFVLKRLQSIHGHFQHPRAEQQKYCRVPENQ